MGTPCPLQSQAFEGIFFAGAKAFRMVHAARAMQTGCAKYHTQLACFEFVSVFGCACFKTRFFLFVPGAISTINRYPGGPDWNFGKGVWVSGL